MKEHTKQQSGSHQAEWRVLLPLNPRLHPRISRSSDQQLVTPSTHQGQLHHKTPVSGHQTTTKEAVSEWVGDATLHTMQKIPLQGRLACCPVLHGPSPPLWLPLQLSLSPPSAIPPEPGHCRDSYCVTGEGREGRAGSPPLGAVWRWGRV